MDNLTLTVMRRGGSLGAVMVDWMVGGNASSDVAPRSGSILFTDGMREEGIELSILNDMVRVYTNVCMHVYVSTYIRNIKECTYLCT